MKNTHTLNVTSLACSAGEHRLFAGMTLRLASGEGLVVTGPNGSGKTTLLRTLAGLRVQDSGTIALEGKDSDSMEGDSPAQQAIHYLGHRDGLRSALTVRENLTFSRNMMGTALAIDQAAARLAIVRLLDLPVAVLSAGQRRRAALARFLVSHRPLWLLDEPTAALDNPSHRIVEGLIGEHLDTGGMVIAATHLPLHVKNLRTLIFHADGSFKFGAPTP